MNFKRIALSALAIFLASVVLDMVIHGVILGPTYEALKDLWRPDMREKMWVFNVVNAVTALVMSFVFAKGYEAKGVPEGIRFGLLMGLLLATPMALGTYGMTAVPISLVVKWFSFGMIHFVILGIILALTYRPKAVGG